MLSPLFSPQGLEGFPGLLTDPADIQKGWMRFLRRRSSEGRVVGFGVVFNLPVGIQVEVIGPSESYSVLKKRITLYDNKSQTTFEALGLAVPKYREQVTFVLERPEGGWAFRSFAFLDPLHTKLFNSVLAFAKKDDKGRRCITKKELDEITSRIRIRGTGSRPMTDGPRRWRELRNEYGFDVKVEGELYCVGERTSPVQEPNLRPKTSELTRDFLSAKKPPFVCAKCGEVVSFDNKEDALAAVVDHRRPVFYGGTDDLNNLQVLCVKCNNLKRRYCERCPLGFRCSVCSWAFPEFFTDMLVINLDPEEASRFAALLEKYKSKPPELAKKLLLEAVEEHLKRVN